MDINNNDTSNNSHTSLSSLDDIFESSRDHTYYQEQVRVQSVFRNLYGFNCKLSLAHIIIMEVRRRSNTNTQEVFDFFRHKRYGNDPAKNEALLFNKTIPMLDGKISGIVAFHTYDCMMSQDEPQEGIIYKVVSDTAHVKSFIPDRNGYYYFDGVKIRKEILNIDCNSISILSGCLKYAIEDTKRITGDHDGNAGILKPSDTYGKMAEDYLIQINKL